MSENPVKLKPLISILFIVVSVILWTNSCKHSGGKCGYGEMKNSTAEEDESHNMGQNCIHCHYSGITNGPCFTLAGTIYDSTFKKTQSGCTVQLFSKPGGGGELLLTLGADKNGNFYTSKTINFAGTVYPVVTNKSGNSKYMNTPIKTGACNACHNVSTSPVWIP